MEFNRRTALKGLAASAAALAVPGLPRAVAAAPRVIDVLSDTWVGHDGLGRAIPTYDEVGPPRPDKFVAAFYFLWLGQHSTDGPYDIAKILAADPNAINETDNPAWGPLGHFHHWSEPYFGYYLSDDRYVLRKHAHMLADAGVDVIVFDTTNNFTYPNVYHALLDTFAEARADGNATPQVAFLTPFGSPGQVVSDLYSDLYRPGRHEDLWFRWKGKPLILADPAGIGQQQLVGIGSDPAQLAVGHTQGQSFTAATPFSAVGAQIPTWSTSDGAMTFARRIVDIARLRIPEIEMGAAGVPVRQQLGPLRQPRLRGREPIARHEKREMVEWRAVGGDERQPTRADLPAQCRLIAGQAEGLTVEAAHRVERTPRRVQPQICNLHAAHGSGPVAGCRARRGRAQSTGTNTDHPSAAAFRLGVGLDVPQTGSQRQCAGPPDQAGLPA